MATAIDLKRKSAPSSPNLTVKRLRVDGEALSSDNCSNASLEQESATGSSVTDEVQASTATTPTSTQPSTPATNFPCREKRLVCDFPGCDKAYNRPVRLAEHQRSHTNERPFVCGRNGCDKAFLRDSHLKHHVKSHHEDTRDWKCDWPGCEQAFATGQRLRNHSKRHVQKDQHKCTGFPPCDQRFRKDETLQRHIAMVHLNEKPYICDHFMDEEGQTCGRRFNQSSNLIQHKEREHGGNRFWCSLCSPDPMNVEAGGSTDTAAVERGVGFPTYGQLQSHMHTAHPPACPQCDHTCATQHQLRAHIDIEHGEGELRQAFKCEYPECGRSFTRKGNMMVHVKTVHEKKRFTCGEIELRDSKAVPGWDGHGGCGRDFSSKAALERHVRAQHLHLPDLPKGKEKRRLRKERMEGEYTTEQESGAFHDSITSRLTGARYEEERQLPCTVVPCPYRFIRAYDLEVHLESTHGFNSLAAMEAAVEQEARTGGQFWVGGGDEGDEEDSMLAHRLESALAASAED